MRKLVITRADEVRAMLVQEVHRAAQARFLHRLHCVHLVAQGCGCAQVAAWFQESPRTIERWVQRMEQHGIDGLKQEHLGGRRTTLSREQLKILRGELQQRPEHFGYRRDTWNGRLLGMHLANCYGLTLGERQCQRLLKELRSVAAAQP